jgi:ferredoxin
MKRVPVIDLGKCTDCESCLAVCPDIFKRNAETDHIEVVELTEYPVEKVEEVMSLCPADCISWEEI